MDFDPAYVEPIVALRTRWLDCLTVLIDEEAERRRSGRALPIFWILVLWRSGVIIAVRKACYWLCIRNPPLYVLARNQCLMYPPYGLRRARPEHCHCVSVT
jgi:hypothetical protein